MILLSIDPGTEQSALVLFNGREVLYHHILPNESALRVVTTESSLSHHLAIEGIACFGMPVGAETFTTCIWIGRFMERFGASRTSLVYRQDVKLHLCRSVRAKDPMVRQALIDRFGPGKEKAIGTKKKPGPCYGVSSHEWSALAVAVTYWDQFAQKSKEAV